MSRDKFDELESDDDLLCVRAIPVVRRPGHVPPLNFKTFPTDSAKNRWLPIYKNCDAALTALEQKTNETKELLQKGKLSLREIRETCTAFQAAADKIRRDTNKIHHSGVFDTLGVKKLCDAIARDKQSIEALVTTAAVSVSDSGLVKAFFTQHKNGFNSYWTGDRQQNATLRDIIHYANNGYSTGSGFFAKKYSGANTKKALQAMGVTDLTEQNVRAALEAHVYPKLPGLFLKNYESIRF